MKEQEPNFGSVFVCGTRYSYGASSLKPKIRKANHCIVIRCKAAWKLQILLYYLNPHCYLFATSSRNSDNYHKYSSLPQLWLLQEVSASFLLSVPSSVQGLTVSNSARSDYLKVSWLHASGYFDNYEVIISNNNDFIQTKSVPKDENECVFTSLVPGRQYSVTVSTRSGKYETSERVYGRTSK